MQMTDEQATALIEKLHTSLDYVKAGNAKQAARLLAPEALRFAAQRTEEADAIEHDDMDVLVGGFKVLGITSKEDVNEAFGEVDDTPEGFAVMCRRVADQIEEL